MEFLVEFEVNVPEGTPASEVTTREEAEAAAAGKLVDQGHLLRPWNLRVAPGETRPSAWYRTATETEKDRLLRALPLYEWMRVSVTPLDPYPNDPAGEATSSRSERAMLEKLPEPRVTQVYRLEATLGQPLDLGETAQGRRIVPQTGGAFTGPQLNGKLVPGVSADWQVVLPDGTALGDIRYTLQTDGGDLLYVKSRGIRHGSTEVLERLGRGEEVDATEYTFRTSTQIETAALALDWLNKGVFISVGGRKPGAVIHETYLVG
jgi:muconolactone delta-isomerase